MTDTRTKFIRTPLDAGWGIGAQVRCYNPGHFEELEENKVYTISWLDWPFCLELEGVPGVWQLVRFKLYTGEITR